MDSTFSKSPPLRIGMVFNGSCCQALVKNLPGLQLIALSDIEQSPSCIKYAEELGIKYFTDFRDMLKLKSLDMTLERTGDKRIFSDIISLKPPTVSALDLQASMRLIEMSKGYAANPLASTLLHASPDGVLVINSNFRIIDCNQSVPVHGNSNRHDIIGRYCYEVLYRRSSPCLELSTVCVARQALQTGKAA